jgi:hypothetical protein
MRDNGFDFYNTDKFCQNLFAECFDLEKLPAQTRFEAVTAFEVFEHLTNPIAEIKEMLAFSDNLIFSTELLPTRAESAEEWWYFSTETGQHIAFYNEAALKAIATQLGYQFYTDGVSLHLFTKKTFAETPLKKERDPFLLRKAKKFVRKAEQQAGKPESLLMKDYEKIKEELKRK